MRIAESITLADGRKVCFARYGARDGRPVLYCHGAGSSRLEGEVYDLEARGAGVQIVVIDRPGCGESSPAPGWTFCSYARDLEEIADKLRIGRFVVAGMSNGGAYAMAAAISLPDRITAAIPINSSTPVHDPVARRSTSRLARGSYAMMRIAPVLTLRWAKRNIGRAGGPMGACARESLRQPDSNYLAQELQLASRHWGFDHLAIRQPVEMFYGDRDAGFSYGRIWAERLPSARFHAFAGGHGDFGLPDPSKRIVAAMAKAPQSAVPLSR